MTHPRFYPLRLGLVLVAAMAALHGCTPEPTTFDGAPEGVPLSFGHRAALSADAFEAAEDGELVTMGRLAPGPGRLHARFGRSYTDGLSVSVTSHPDAWVRVHPVGARPVPARLRTDRAVLAYANAFGEGVTAFYGARGDKVEEFVSVPSADKMPTLAYTLLAGEGLGELQADEGRIWAYAKDGTGLFVVQPPTVDDAAGVHREGSWKLTALNGGRGYRMEADLDVSGLQYPLLIDPTFETPRWFRNQLLGDSVNGRAAPAGTYDVSTNCGLMFGGVATGGLYLADASARCSNRLWKANVPQTGTVPSARGYSAMGFFGGSQQAVYVFGGATNSAVATNDFHRGKLTCTTPGNAATCSLAWTPITTNPTTRPSARFLHGMAWTGSKLLLWGGVTAGGVGLRDTWEYDGDTDTWTQKCATCFGGSFGLYGMATATVIKDGQRQIFSFGGYNNPTQVGDFFDNRVFRWSGTTWDDVSGSPAQIPVNEDGTLGGNTTPLLPQPRFFAWASGTNGGNLLIGSGVTTSSTGANTYFTDTWIWYDRSNDGYGFRWLRAPVPPAGQIDDAPGRRESAFAFFDEANAEVALLGGVTFGPTGSETLTTRQRVYRGAVQQITLTQECLGPDTDLGTCASARLRVVFNGITTSALCSQQRATFVTNDALAFSGAGGWVTVTGGGAVTPTLTGTTCAAQIDAPWQSDRYSDYGVRVRDNRYHAGGSLCTNAGDDVTVGAAAKSACLPAASNARAGSAACGAITDPDLGTLACELFLAAERVGQGAGPDQRTQLGRELPLPAALGGRVAVHDREHLGEGVLGHVDSRRDETLNPDLERLGGPEPIVVGRQVVVAGVRRLLLLVESVFQIGGPCAQVVAEQFVRLGLGPLGEPALDPLRPIFYLGAHLAREGGHEGAHEVQGELHVAPVRVAADGLSSAQAVEVNAKLARLDLGLPPGAHHGHDHGSKRLDEVWTPLVAPPHERVAAAHEQAKVVRACEQHERRLRIGPRIQIACAQEIFEQVQQQARVRASRLHGRVGARRLAEHGEALGRRRGGAGLVEVALSPRSQGGGGHGRAKHGGASAWGARMGQTRRTDFALEPSAAGKKIIRPCPSHRAAGRRWPARGTRRPCAGETHPLPRSGLRCDPRERRTSRSERLARRCRRRRHRAP